MQLKGRRTSLKANEGTQPIHTVAMFNAVFYNKVQYRADFHP